MLKYPKSLKLFQWVTFANNWWELPGPLSKKVSGPLSKMKPVLSLRLVQAPYQRWGLAPSQTWGLAQSHLLGLAPSLTWGLAQCHLLGQAPSLTWGQAPSQRWNWPTLGNLAPGSLGFNCICNNLKFVEGFSLCDCWSYYFHCIFSHTVHEKVCFHYHNCFHFHIFIWAICCLIIIK